MLKTGQLVGRWKNSKVDSEGIAEFTLKAIDDVLSFAFIKAEGGFFSSSLSLIEATPHAANKNSKDCIGFKAEVSTDGNNYFFAGNVNKGLIIIATYIKTSNDSDSDFFVREFFYKLK